MSTHNELPTDVRQYFWPPVVVLAVNAVVLAGLSLQFGSMIAAKVLFIEIAVILGVLCLAIVIFHKLIASILEDLAVFAEAHRQEAMLEMRHGRAQLMMIRERVENVIHPPPAERPFDDLLHQALPIVQVLLSKEKNWIQLGMFGWRFAKDAWRLFKQR